VEAVTQEEGCPACGCPEYHEMPTARNTRWSGWGIQQRLKKLVICDHCGKQFRTT
jgi:hypothetical protein